MKKNIILYILLILYIIINSVFMILSKVPFYNEIVNPLMWIIICGVAYLLSKDNSLRVKDENNKTQSLFIILIIYIIIYFLLGLVFGFQRTPYSKKLFHMLVNIWSFGGIVFFQEFIRYSIIKIEKKKMLNFILVTVLLIAANLSFSNLINNFSDIKSAFTYSVSILIPLIASQAVCTYLSYIGGAKLPIIYRLFIVLPEFIVPILPNFDWFVTAIIGIALPCLVFIYLNYIHTNKVERLSRRERKKYSPAIYVPTFAFIALVAAFVIGLFKYQPIAVLSGSMHPTFDRGDAVVVKKLTKLEKDELAKGDVIQYVSGSQYVVHRIKKVKNDSYGNRIFITQGDNNNSEDINPVNYEQVVGEVSFIIKYIGYPSVWLSGVIS